MSEHQTVLQAIEDRFFEEEKLSDKSDIIEWTDLPKSRVEGLINDLSGNGLVAVYDKRGSATLYLSRQMYNSLTAQAVEPDWLTAYEFEEKAELREDVEEANEKISDYQNIERLLYGGGTPLEDSVEYAFEVIRFDSSSTKKDEDFVIKHEDHVYVLEVKGVGGKINKDYVEQLGGWLDKKLSEGIEPEKLTGMLLHNHDRHTDPEHRDYPLTSEAERFLKHQRSLHISTKTLYNLVKSVRNDEMTQEEAQERFLKGDGYGN